MLSAELIGAYKSLIAIMLGCLKMTTDDALTVYTNFSKTVFEKPKRSARLKFDFKGGLNPGTVRKTSRVPSRRLSRQILPRAPMVKF